MSEVNLPADEVGEQLEDEHEVDWPEEFEFDEDSILAEHDPEREA